jgi:hypothetical protein
MTTLSGDENETTNGATTISGALPADCEGCSSLVVSLGMLKCGYRYVSSIPVPSAIETVFSPMDPDLAVEVVECE